MWVESPYQSEKQKKRRQTTDYLNLMGEISRLWGWGVNRWRTNGTNTSEPWTQANAKAAGTGSGNSLVDRWKPSRRRWIQDKDRGRIPWWRNTIREDNRWITINKIKIICSHFFRLVSIYCMHAFSHRVLLQLQLFPHLCILSRILVLWPIFRTLWSVNFRSLWNFKRETES